MNGASVYLLDSSVLVKWFLEEEDSKAARHIQTRFLAGDWQLAYADLSLYEVANALLYSRQFEPHEIAQAIAALPLIGMQRLTYETPVLQRAVELSAELGIAVYDAYLVALAETHAMTFISADKRLLRRLLHLPFVQDLSQFRP